MKSLELLAGGSEAQQLPSMHCHASLAATRVGDSQVAAFLIDHVAVFNECIIFHYLNTVWKY
jgi:hypothetical protein